MIQRRVQRLTTILSLTDAQASQATSIFTNAHAAAAPLQTSISDARKSMRTAVKANDTGTISTAAANIGNLTGQMLAIHSKAEAAFYAILTPEQQAKFRGFDFNNKLDANGHVVTDTELGTEQPLNSTPLHCTAISPSPLPPSLPPLTYSLTHQRLHELPRHTEREKKRTNCGVTSSSKHHRI
jgi:hypothetical protein